MSGSSTVRAPPGLEILEQLPNVAAVLAPVGGGGLVAGVAAAIKQSRPDVAVIGVEPVGAATMKAAVDAGQLVTLPKTENDRRRPDAGQSRRYLTFAHVQRFVDRVITVEDPQIVDAVLWIFANARLVAEPSGAVTTAAVLSGAARRCRQRHRPHRRDRQRRATWTLAGS